MSSSSKSKAGETPGNPGTFLPLNYIPADSTPVNLTTSTSHTLDVPDTDTATIPPELNQLNPRKWKREDVKKFLEANKEEYDLEDEDIIRLYEGRVSGRVLLLLTEEKLITTYGLPPGTAGSIELLINALKQPQAVVKATQKWEDRPSHRRGFELSDTLTVPHPHQQLIKVPVSTLGPPRQRPPEDDNSFRCWSWWKSLREMEVGGLETLEFPVDILGSEVFGSTIFVRDAYTHLFNIIAWNDTAISTGTPNKRSYIITGTPGIGKSFFGFYLIYRLAREFPDHNIEWQDNAVRVILFADGGINYQQSGHSIISVNSHGEGAFITNFTHCNTFYIADAIEPIAGRTRRFVLVTSPKRDRYKELAKAPNVYKLGMPIWDELELERLWKLRFPSITESDWRGYFSKWGGVPRSTLEKTNSFYQEDLHNNCQAVDIDACMKWIGTNRYNSTSISGTVLHMTVTPEGKYEDFRVKFASLYIENIVVSYYERNMPKMITKYILDTEEDSVHASTRGYIFEAIAHRILTRGGKFQVRRLGDLTEETIALPKLVQQSFYSVDEIKPGFYSRPRSRTFETIDSLCIYGVAEHDSLFQITVGRQHSIKVNGLENLSGKLMGKVRFYFVVPGDVYPRFVNPQSYLNSAGQKHQRIPRWITEKVEQWVLKLDYSAF